MAGALHILIALVVTTTSIILFNKIKNGDILVPANPGPPDKLLLNRERERYYYCTPRNCQHAVLPMQNVVTSSQLLTTAIREHRSRQGS